MNRPPLFGTKLSRMELIRPFAKLGKNDVNIAGGKGASLGEMTNAGIPVPPGFVIVATAFEQFLKETDLNVEIDAILRTVVHTEMHTIESASEKIQGLIRAAHMPSDLANTILENFKKLDAEFVAVRSSATAEDGTEHAWAGQLDTYLNTTRQGLVENVQSCWASLFTPRAIFYRFEKGLHGSAISVAVVIQKMVQSEISGIAFSVHPVTEDHNQLIIEAGYGLGEAIVSGQVTPDSYVVKKSPREIIDKNIATQTRALYRAPAGGNEWQDIAEPKASAQVLSDNQILELSDLILKIESHYGTSQDIEWAYENGKFYITQSRPITTLSNKSKKIDTAMILLGVWNVYPFDFWGWFSEAAIEHFKRLTDVTIRSFARIQEELNYESVFSSDLDILRANLDKLVSTRAKLKYVQKIYDDYYLQVTQLERELDIAERLDFVKLSNKDIADGILRRADAWSHVTMQIWYAVFLDLWYPLPDEEVEIKKIAAKARDHTGHLHARAYKIDERLFQTLTERLNTPLQSLQYLFPKETVDFLVNGTRYDSQIKARRQFCIIESIDGGELKIHAGDKAQELTQLYDPPTLGGISETVLHGTKASSGKTKGKARVIKLDRDFEKFQEGEVLVTLQTMVHYLPIMKKASAILTEFGGLTSHAAIVARELNKPAIVGIRNLIASVKDGDLLEIDAGSGTVRNLSSTNVPDFSDYVYEGLYQQPPFNPWFWVNWYQKDLAQKYELPILSQAPLACVRGCNYLVNKDAIAQFNELQHAFLRNPGKLQKVFDDAQSVFKKSSVAQFSSGDRFSELEKLIATGRELLFYWGVGWMFSTQLSGVLADTAKKNNITVAELIRYMKPFSSPLVDAQHALEKVNAGSLSIQEYLHQYDWTSYLMFNGRPLNADGVRERLNAPQLEHVESTATNVPKSLAKVIALVEQVGYLNQAGAEYCAMLGRNAQPIFDAFAKALKISAEDVRYLTPDELLDRSLSPSLAAEKITRRKPDNWNLWLDDEGKTVLCDDLGVTKNLAAKYIPHAPEETATELHGAIGGMGKGKGRVRIVKQVSTDAVFEVGDVLVTSMTTPEFIPLMQKASAIVTEMGGLLSHAAILSRELKKPCVVGVQFATQLLKTGDIVEVDADSGVVRIIKKYF